MNRPRRTQPGKLPKPGTAKPGPDAPAPPPVAITLRNLEIPLPEVIETAPGEFDELIVSDPQAQPAPWLADPEAERAAQRAARRAQVRRDRMRDRMRDAGDAGDSTGFATTSSEPVLHDLPPPAPAPPAAPVTRAALVDPTPPAGAQRNESAPPAVAAPPVIPAAPATEAPAADGAPPAVHAAAPAAGRSHGHPASAAATTPTALAASAPTAAPRPAVLVVSPADAGANPLCTQLAEFGFAVQAMAELPELPAPWPFAAVFVDLAWADADGSDGIDLCNQARELGRLPGERKPLLVLVAGQLSSTNRVRAGLAGCNEIVVGAITRGSVAGVLDARGIALPSDPRNR